MGDKHNHCRWDDVDLWLDIANRAMHSPRLAVDCPSRHAKSMTVAWHVISLKSLKATVDLSCASCKVAKTIEMVLPSDVSGFFPEQRAVQLARVVQSEIKPIAKRIKAHVKAMPAAAFTTHPLWDRAHWAATTFRWHPKSEAPPVMGIVFENAEAGKRLFSEFAKATNRKDEFEELRISIIEGTSPGERPGYTVHLCPDAECLAARATADDLVVDPAAIPFLGRWNRMYPIPGSPELLPGFKREFAKHNEFMLAPAVRRQDGQFWFEPELGVVKTVIHFRNLSEITPGDPDAAALVLPQLITPATS